MRYKEGSKEKVIYEKKLSKMLDCWHLSSNRLLFMEDLGSRKIEFLNLAKASVARKTFELPGDVRMVKRLSHNLESMVHRFHCPDKQLLRDFIRRQVGDPEPEQFLMVMVGFRIALILHDGKVVTFFPDGHDGVFKP